MYSSAVQSARFNGSAEIGPRFGPHRLPALMSREIRNTHTCQLQSPVRANQVTTTTPADSAKKAGANEAIQSTLTNLRGQASRRGKK